MRRLSPVLFLVVFAASAGLAQSNWVMDPAHSSVTFSISHMVISHVVGNFKEFSVTLNSAKDDFAGASVEGVIKVASINTDNTMRDNHLRSDDFFNAEKYPEIHFKSTSFEKTADNKFAITGNLTIRDVTKKATFDAVLNGVMNTPQGLLASWTATITVDRFEYNLKWNKVIETGGLIVGKDATVTLNLEFHKKL
jgi:polyisoprenoid-binding protein YceI